MANCVYCGEFTGDHKSDRDECCGKRECARYIQDGIEAEREERHRAIDEEYNW